MAAWSPADYIELVKAVFYGIGIICVPLATVYTMISAWRSKQNAQSIEKVSNNVDRLEKNTNSISERLQAASLRLGRNEGHAEGVAQERASIQANIGAGTTTAPLPVSDEKTAAAVGKVVEAINDAANGTKNT